MYIIAGLGNIGRKYENTRHNTGFMCVDAFAAKHGIEIKKSMLKGLYGTGTVAGEKIIVVKPETFMNLSGECLAAYVDYYKTDSEKLIVVYDDVDFPLGAVKIRKSGGAGTHNGMKNIVWLMKTQDFPRVRVGIGDSGETDMMNYVLTPFMREERAQIAQAADKVSDILEEIVRNGIDAAMNRYNTRQKTAEEEKTDVHE
jgi:PTH1 family peptidyl-tRNA hydrolase